MDLKILEPAFETGVCKLGVLQGVPDNDEMTFGASRAGSFPVDASYVMNKKFPKDVKLADILLNMDNAVVASERFKSFLEGIPGALKNNEVYPVAIINHKGRKEKAPYFLIHQVNRPAAVDPKKSVGAKSKIMPDTYVFVEKLVLDEKKLDPEVQLFRLHEIPGKVLVRGELASKIAAQKLTGFRLKPFEGYRF
jgi:hypothetical protein